MKLIYVVRSLHPVGGIERTLTDKANWLVSHGHEVLFVMYKQGGDKVAFHLDSRVQLVDLKCSIYSLFKYPLYTRLFKYFSSICFISSMSTSVIMFIVLSRFSE